MDQIFDRLERLIKSWVTMDEGDSGIGGHFGRSSAAGRKRGTGDPDLDAAMNELDDFLDSSRTATEERERSESAERERRTRMERERASRHGGNGSGSYGQTGQGFSAQAEARRALEGAYSTLGLPYGAPFVDVKIAYKKLLKIHHPDLNAQTPESLKRATAVSSRINVAYQMIEAWEQSGRRTIG